MKEEERMKRITIRKKERKEYYQTPAGETAIIRLIPDDTAELIVRKDSGETTFKQAYNSRKGAVIAMGRKFGRCKFLTMCDTLGIRRGF
jgi:hypothetical protein